MRMISHQCECACEPSYFYAGCKCMNTPHMRTASRQCECAYESSYCYDGCKCMNTPHMRMASRQCGCACEPSNYQLWCTCTHTYHTQTVARQCVSSHGYQSLIATCSGTSMPCSSARAHHPRVRCEEGREQTRAQRHLRGSKHRIHTVSRT